MITTKNRPCVVVANGREPPYWEAYPHHQFVHTVGSLLCCDNGGCWKARTAPLDDGGAKGALESRCVNVVEGLPKCMNYDKGVRSDRANRTESEMIARIERY